MRNGNHDKNEMCVHFFFILYILSAFIILLERYVWVLRFMKQIIRRERKKKKYN